jgi:hypothetical protein
MLMVVMAATAEANEVTMTVSAAAGGRNETMANQQQQLLRRGYGCATTMDSGREYNQQPNKRQCMLA